MRGMTVFLAGAALATAMISVEAQATVAVYGLQLDLSSFFYSPPLSTSIGLPRPTQAIFEFDTNTNLLTKFSVLAGAPTNDFADAFNTMLATHATCDLTCFVDSIDGGQWSFNSGVRSTPGYIRFDLTGQITDTVSQSQYFGGPPAEFGGNGTIRSIGPIPEPSTWAMLLVGFGCIGYSLRRKRHQAMTIAYSS